MVNHQTLSFEDEIYCFKICNNDFAYNLISLAIEKKIVIGIIHFSEETAQDIQFSWERVKDILCEQRCTALSFGPETSLILVPKLVVLSAAFSDFNIKIIRTDLQNTETVQILRGHTNYVNDLSWDFSGNYLASVSDDQKCKIWSAANDFEDAVTFCLSSAGMSVKWHPEEPNKVMIADKKGLIHFYNVQSQQAVYSIESLKSPLIAADWSLCNHFLIAAIACGDIMMWDMRQPSFPINIKQVHEDNGSAVLFSPNREQTIASIGRPNVTLKITNTQSNRSLLNISLKIKGGVSWHHRLPYVAAVSDNKIYFCKVNVN